MPWFAEVAVVGANILVLSIFGCPDVRASNNISKGLAVVSIAIRIIAIRLTIHELQPPPHARGLYYQRQVFNCRTARQFRTIKSAKQRT
jgi:hypothetical protein